MTAFAELVASVRACRVCEGILPGEPRPVIQISPSARLLIASQAPGTKVHASGMPFKDDYGDRLRQWLGITPDIFYDESRVAILPMGFCYPGRSKSGDAPPRPQCARLWRGQLLEQLPRLEMTLLIGSYAQNNALGPGSMTERVRRFRAFLPAYFPFRTRRGARGYGFATIRGSKPRRFPNFASSCRTFWDEKDERIQD